MARFQYCKTCIVLKIETSIPLPEKTLPAWEMSVIDVFVRAASMFGFRKSVAMVYGALYCSREALSVPELQAKLQLSRGAVVEAIQFLRRLGAARVHLKIGERRDYFTAETDLKKFAQGFLQEILVPASEKADIRLTQAEEAANKMGEAALLSLSKKALNGDARESSENVLSEQNSNVPAADAAFARSRIAELKLWKSRFSEALPLLDELLNAK